MNDFRNPSSSPDERFRILVEAVNDYAIFMLDQSGIVQTWNAGAQRFKGYSENEIVGQHFSQFYTEEDRRIGLPMRALEVARDEGRFEQEGWRLRKDGSRIWVHVVIDPIRNSDGEVVGFAKITRDITEKREARRALRRSEERFRLLVHEVTDYAIYMLNPDGVIISWNRGAQRFKGYAEHEIIGQHFSRFYTEEDRASDLPSRALATALAEGRFEQEGWRVRKDGSRIWAFVVIDPIRDEDGELVGFAKITRDISDKKTTEEVLRRSEERFRLLVQGVKEYAIYMLDTQGHITNWNTGAERLKGYSEADVTGQHFSMFYTEEDRRSGRPQLALEKAAELGRFASEGWRVRSDGTHFWADVSIEAIRSEDGELVGFAKITRDVSQRKAAEQELDESRAQFVQAQKMQAVGQLTGGVSHDFNNLLAVIMGNLTLAKKRLPDDPRLRQLIDNSIEAASRGTSLTQRLLAFSRRQDLKVERVEIPDLVRNMKDLLQRSIGPTININTQFPLGISPARVDANQLELALLNLCLNARDAMPSGGVITLAGRVESVNQHNHANLNAGRYVVLSVVDTGEGMDAETLQRAIEPFFTTKGIGKGTGLGLSMVHGFARQSGGRLVLHSKPASGTTADLWLPVDEATDQPLAAYLRDTPRPQVAGLCVLAVDDDGLVLMNTSAMLEDLGHSVIEATSGKLALDHLASERKIDILITDEAMPQMRGTELIKEARARYPNLPIILATGYSEAPLNADWNIPKLNKPFDQDELAGAISAVMQERQKEASVLRFRAKDSGSGGR